MPYDRVNEDSTAYLTVAFLDSAGSAATPSGTVSWDIWDTFSGRRVTSGTEAASSTITFTIDDTCTPIFMASNLTELREFVLRAPYSGGQSFTERHFFEVINLRGPLNFNLVIGDSYLDEDDRALIVTCGKGVPDLDGDVFILFTNDDDTLGPIEGTIVDAAGNNKELSFDITSAQTETLSEGDYEVKVYAVQASESVISVSQGKATVTA